jgi:hypothetical protein
MSEEKPMQYAEREQRYSSYLTEAGRLADELRQQTSTVEYELEGKLAELQFFALPECCMGSNAQQGVFGKLKSVFKRN